MVTVSAELRPGVGQSTECEQSLGRAAPAGEPGGDPDFHVQNVGWGEGQARESVLQCACQLIITCAWHRGWHPDGKGGAGTGLRVLHWTTQQPDHPHSTQAHPGSPSSSAQMALQARGLLPCPLGLSLPDPLLRADSGERQGVHGMPRKRAVGMSLFPPSLASKKEFLSLTLFATASIWW